MGDGARSSSARAVFAQTTLGGSIVGSQLFLFDFSRPDQISLLDAVNSGVLPARATVSDDGVLVVGGYDRVALIDSLTRDLVSSNPPNRQTGTPAGILPTLRFNRAFDEDEADQVSSYLRLVRMDGPWMMVHRSARSRGYPYYARERVNPLAVLDVEAKNKPLLKRQPPAKPPQLSSY